MQLFTAWCSWEWQAVECLCLWECVCVKSVGGFFTSTIVDMDTADIQKNKIKPSVIKTVWEKQGVC